MADELHSLLALVKSERIIRVQDLVCLDIILHMHIYDFVFDLISF